jgi:hypothetical protein
VLLRTNVDAQNLPLHPMITSEETPRYS